MTANAVRAFFLVALLVLVLLSLLVLHTQLQQQPKMRGTSLHPIHFAVIGDFGTGQATQLQVARHLARQHKQRPFQFVISTGDQMYNMVGEEREQGRDGVASVEDPLFALNFENVYRPAFSNVPWYMTLGNHDCAGNASAQVLYTHHSPSPHLWQMPQRYYAFQKQFDASNSLVQFIVLDSCSLACGGSSSSSSKNERCRHVHHPSNSVRQQQLEWLKHILETPLPTQDSWIVISSHWPLFSVMGNGPTRSMLSDIEPLLEAARVLHGKNRIVWFNGHDHGLQHIERFQKHYFVSGGGGFKLHPTLKATADGAYRDPDTTIMKSTLNEMEGVKVPYSKSTFGFMKVQLYSNGQGVVDFYESLESEKAAKLIYKVDIP